MKKRREEERGEERIDDLLVFKMKLTFDSFMEYNIWKRDLR